MTNVSELVPRYELRPYQKKPLVVYFSDIPVCAIRKCNIRKDAIEPQLINLN